MVALVGAVDCATTGVKLKFGEECGPAVLVVDTFIVSEEDGTLVIQEDELGHGDNDGKSQFLCNKFVETNRICIAIGILKYIPVSTKESGVTSAIGHNNRFTGREAGYERTDFGKVHIDENSLVRRIVGKSDSHAKESGSFMSGLVTA